MDRADYLASLRRDADAFLAVVESAGRGGLDASVPSCPGWSLADLGRHVWGVLTFWEWVVRERVQDRAHEIDPPEPGDAEVASAVRAAHEAIQRTLATTDPATAIWTWTSRRDAGFVPRRMAQEVAVHRWDAQATTGEPEPLERTLAVDGVDEFFFLASAYDPTPGRERVRLRCTDGPEAWVADVVEGRQRLLVGDGDADAELSGTASDLLLVLWRRLPPDAAAMSGSPDAVTAFLARADLG